MLILCIYHLWQRSHGRRVSAGCFQAILRTRLSGQLGHQLGEEKQMLVSHEALEDMFPST